MAATAAAAVASSFSTSLQSLKCLTSSKSWPCAHLVKLSSNRILQPASVSHSLLIQLNAVGAICGKSRVPRLMAAVAQEEAVEAAMVEEGKAGNEETGEGEAAEIPTVNTTLYFGNLPFRCDSAQLAGIIKKHASPERVEVLYNKDTGKSRGFAFVTMKSIEDCHKVIENLDGREYGGRTFRVNFSDKPKPKDPMYPETDYKLFVGNLARSVTAESLTQAFQEYGNVVGARVLYDGETGKSRGFGFVCFDTKAEMDTALQALNGVELEGRGMRISLAQKKEQ